MAATADSRSLISRIAPPVLKETPAKSTMLVKRSASETTDERPAKRRHPDEKCDTQFAPWLKKETASGIEASFKERLHDELSQFVEYISPSKQELEARSILVERIQELLSTRWHDSQVSVFGSSATGLGLSGGDIDLVVSFNNVDSLSDAERKRRLAAMGSVLRSSGLTHWVNRIFGAKVPIIAFVTTEGLGEVEFDISIRNGEDAGLRAIPLVKRYLADIPALRPLVLAVKAFLSLRDLNDASQATLSSYAVTLLCINFLQRNPTGRSEKQLKDPYTSKSLGLLLKDFFRHYGYDFPYDTHYVSVINEDIFPKESKNWKTTGSKPAELAVQCIVNPESNITHGCKKIALVISAFREAFDALESVSTRTPQTDASVLCRIFEISEEDDAKRRFLDDSVHSGAFLRSVASCVVGANTRVVGGGVSLTSHNGPRRNNPIGDDSSLLMRLAPGPIRSSGNETTFGRHSKGGFTPNRTQPLPILHWRDDGRQRQPVPYFPNAPFEFQAPSWHYQHRSAPANYAPPGRMNPNLFRHGTFSSPYPSSTHNNHALQNGSRANYTAPPHNSIR